MTERLRYTGASLVSFLTGGVGEVAPGGEFEVDGQHLRSFMRRADVEHAGDCPAPPCRCGEESEAAQAPGPAEAAEAGSVRGRGRRQAQAAGASETTPGPGEDANPAA